MDWSIFDLLNCSACSKGKYGLRYVDNSHTITIEEKKVRRQTRSTDSGSTDDSRYARSSDSECTDMVLHSEQTDLIRIEPCSSVDGRLGQPALSLPPGALRSPSTVMTMPHLSLRPGTCQPMTLQQRMSEVEVDNLARYLAKSRRRKMTRFQLAMEQNGVIDSGLVPPASPSTGELLRTQQYWDDNFDSAPSPQLQLAQISEDECFDFEPSLPDNSPMSTVSSLESLFPWFYRSGGIF